MAGGGTAVISLSPYSRMAWPNPISGLVNFDLSHREGHHPHNKIEVKGGRDIICHLDINPNIMLAAACESFGSSSSFSDMTEVQL